MSIKDLENAASRLTTVVEIEEVTTRNGLVHRAYGHCGRVLVMWDAAGRSYTCVTVRKLNLEERLFMYKKEVEDCFHRSVLYDLQTLHNQQKK